MTIKPLERPHPPSLAHPEMKLSRCGEPPELGMSFTHMSRAEFYLHKSYKQMTQVQQIRQLDLSKQIGRFGIVGGNINKQKYKVIKCFLIVIFAFGMLEKYNAESTIFHGDELFNEGSPDTNDEIKYGMLRSSPKASRNCGVNTSRLLMFNNSFELIQPITHRQFSQKPKLYIAKFCSDGLDEQASVPIRFTDNSPIHYSQFKSTNNRIQHRFNSKLHKKFQASHPKTAVNPEKLQPLMPHTKYNRVQKIVTANLKHMEANQDLIRHSRKAAKPQDKMDNQDKPILKKSFKISNIGTRLSQSKLASKQQIIWEAKKMAQHKVNSTQHSRAKNSKAQSLISLKSKAEYLKMDPPELPDDNGLTISLKTPISSIKRILIEGQDQFQFKFSIPQMLFDFPSFQTSTTQLKERMVTIFGQVGVEVQIVSIKRHADRIELRNKNLCILWYFDGTFYFGEWKGEQIMADLNKHGVGLQWSTSTQGNSLYYGQFRDNNRQGYGVLKEDHQTYIGCWKDNRKCGWGKIYGRDHRLIQKGEFSEDPVN